MSRGRSEWPWRLGALAVAMVLWFVLGRQSTVTHERVFVVPVKMRNPPPGQPIAVEPDAVTLRVTAERATLGGMSVEDIQAYVDLRDQADRQPVPIVVSLPTDVRITDMEPRHVRVQPMGP